MPTCKSHSQLSVNTALCSLPQNCMACVLTRGPGLYDLLFLCYVGCVEGSVGATKRSCACGIQRVVQSQQTFLPHSICCCPRVMGCISHSAMLCCKMSNADFLSQRGAGTCRIMTMYLSHLTSQAYVFVWINNGCDAVIVTEKLNLPHTDHSVSLLAWSCSLGQLGIPILNQTRRHTADIAKVVQVP